MSTRKALTAAALLSVLAGAGGAAAQQPYTAPGQQNYRTQPPPQTSQPNQQYGQQQYSGLPEGSYRQSCRNIDFRNQVLRATCTNRAGQAVNSSIDPRTCQGRDIYNENGTLRCGGPLPGVTQPPQGSYRSSCNAYTVRDNVLTANCATRQGRYVASRLDLRQCRPNAEVYNDNGVLGCDGGGRGNEGRGNQGRGPGRDEQFEVVVYSEANYRGRQMLITERNADLTQSGFNDRIRSVRVLSGRAQVCVDVQYRGRCETLNQSVADLRTIRMDNVISSVRGEDNGGRGGRDDRYDNDRRY